MRPLHKLEQGIWGPTQTSTFFGLEGGNPSLPPHGLRLWDRAGKLTLVAAKERGRPCQDQRGRGREKQASPTPLPGGGAGVRASEQSLGRCASPGSRAGRMLGRGMPRGWTALCLLTLLREYPPRAAAGLDGEGRALSPPRGGQGPLPPSKPPTPRAAPGFGERAPHL